MFESALLKLADDDYVWFINQHHLICDAWGVTQLHRIQVEFYEAILAGKPLPDSDETGRSSTRRRQLSTVAIISEAAVLALGFRSAMVPTTFKNC